MVTGKAIDDLVSSFPILILQFFKHFASYSWLLKQIIGVELFFSVVFTYVLICGRTLPNGTEWLGYQPTGCQVDFYPSDLPDPETTLVVLQGAGTCTPNTKISAAIAVGMKYVLDLNDKVYDDFYLPTPQNISYGQATQATEKLLLASVGKTVTFFEQDPHTLLQRTGGQMSEFSSEGPTWDLSLSYVSDSAPWDKHMTNLPRS